MGPLQTRNGFCTLRGAFSQRGYPQQCTHHFAGQSSAISDFEFSFPQNLIISDVAMSSEKDRDLDNQVINSHFDNRNSGAHVWGTPPASGVRWSGFGGELCSPLTSWLCRGRLSKKRVLSSPEGSESTHFLLAVCPRNMRLEGGCARKRARSEGKNELFLRRTKLYD